MTKRDEPAGKRHETGERPLTGRIMCINDFEMYSHMVSMLLERDGGHTVRTEIVPLNLTVIAAFEPDIIVINLVRKLETISAGGMQDFYTDVDGARALREIHRATREGLLHAPIIITSIAVLERELPKAEGFDYIAFVEVPQKMDSLLNVINKALAAKRAGGPVAPE